jgi:hypothetical protein
MEPVTGRGFVAAEEIRHDSVVVEVKELDYLRCEVGYPDDLMAALFPWHRHHTADTMHDYITMQNRTVDFYANHTSILLQPVSPCRRRHFRNLQHMWTQSNDSIVCGVYL